MYELKFSEDLIGCVKEHATVGLELVDLFSNANSDMTEEEYLELERNVMDVLARARKGIDRLENVVSGHTLPKKSFVEETEKSAKEIYDSIRNLMISYINMGREEEAVKLVEGSLLVYKSVAEKERQSRGLSKKFLIAMGVVEKLKTYDPNDKDGNVQFILSNISE